MVGVARVYRFGNDKIANKAAGVKERDEEERAAGDSV